MRKQVDTIAIRGKGKVHISSKIRGDILSYDIREEEPNKILILLDPKGEAVMEIKDALCRVKRIELMEDVHCEITNEKNIFFDTFEIITTGNSLCERKSALEKEKILEKCTVNASGYSTVRLSQAVENAIVHGGGSSKVYFSRPTKTCVTRASSLSAVYVAAIKGCTHESSIKQYGSVSFWEI